MNVVYVNGNEVIIKEALQKLYLKRKVSIDEMWCLKHYIDYLERQENNLQSKIDKANKLLQEILVVNDWEHKGRFRPVKNTTRQDVYKTICKLYAILETPYRSDYGALKEDK